MVIYPFQSSAILLHIKLKGGCLLEKALDAAADTFLEKNNILLIKGLVLMKKNSFKKSQIQRSINFLKKWFIYHIGYFTNLLL